MLTKKRVRPHDRPLASGPEALFPPPDPLRATGCAFLRKEEPRGVFLCFTEARLFPAATRGKLQPASLA